MSRYFIPGNAGLEKLLQYQFQETEFANVLIFLIKIFSVVFAKHKGCWEKKIFFCEKARERMLKKRIDTIGCKMDVKWMWT